MKHPVRIPAETPELRLMVASFNPCRKITVSPLSNSLPFLSLLSDSPFFYPTVRLRVAHITNVVVK